eukprot:TRINITY_DN29612_c0_g1_i3.p1 TRINITY_DN29612_c0_g1~~TRINITY_DN29612_c0_g1_i3.p1  ORF type:complete len:184 (+),score=24.04 TRINITY_DN29612_c0_g1_i3:88-639(+)
MAQRSFLRASRIGRHVLQPLLAAPRAFPEAVPRCFASAAAGGGSLPGHYGHLTGVCAEQARRAFRGEVADRSEDGWHIATFAGGCFWGPQLLFDRVPGVVATSVGYTQGNTDQPSYGTICTGLSWHTEAVQVYFDEAQVTYDQLLEEFWRSIDPTVRNGQGHDSGTQYRTGIYYWPWLALHAQ